MELSHFRFSFMQGPLVGKTLLSRLKLRPYKIGFVRMLTLVVPVQFGSVHGYSFCFTLLRDLIEDQPQVVFAFQEQFMYLGAIIS